MRILVAEDEQITRVSLTRQLQQWGHEIVVAEDGQRAWEAFAGAAFDIVLTDWDMPGLTGVELIQRIRAQQGPAFVYIVMLTGRNEKADIVRGIEAGADDFVAKPFDREELRVRLLAGERVVRLERALSKQNAELRAAGDRMRNDLQAAARVQAAMLPQSDVSTGAVRAAWKYAPTEELAGDAIGLHLIHDRYLVAYVLDVSGHGVPAALLAVTAMHELSPVRGAASILRDSNSEQTDRMPMQRPALVVTQLNQRFSSNESAGLFLTMVLCVLDTHTGRLNFTCAGHPLPLLVRAGATIALDDVGGMPLAVMDDATYDDGSVELQRGDRFYLFSDGMIEQPAAARDEREEFGMERLERLLIAECAVPVDAAVRRAVQALGEWGGGASFKDDVSLVAIEWLGPPGQQTTTGRVKTT